MEEKPVFFRAKNLSVNSSRSGPDICSLICGCAGNVKGKQMELFVVIFSSNEHVVLAKSHCVPPYLYV